MDEKKISNAVDALMKDAHWKAEAAAAPSQASLRHMHLEMYYACHNGFSAPRLPVREIKKLHAAMYALEDVFTPEDWDSLQKRSKGTFARICLYRREYAMRDALSYPKWRCIYTYISKNNPFRAVAKEHMDSFLQPASDLDAEAEERRMKTAIMRASWNTRWRKAYEYCRTADERRLMELIAYFTEYCTLGHFIRELISIRYDKGGTAIEGLEERGVFRSLHVTLDDMFESVRR